MLYLLHGSNSNGETYIDVGRAGVALDELMAAQRTRPFLIVIPLSTDRSIKDDTEWANAGDGRFESETLEVVRQVDEHWPTLADRSAASSPDCRWVARAFNIGLENLREFGALESWSGYFTQARAGPFSAATPAMLRFNSPATYARTIAKPLRRLPLHVFLYTGREDPLAPRQGAFAAELRGLGAVVRTAEPSGLHDWALWRREMPDALLYAGQVFGASR